MPQYIIFYVKIQVEYKNYLHFSDILQEFFIRISYYVNHNFWIYSKNFISKNDWPNSPRKDKIFIVKTMLQDL